MVDLCIELGHYKQGYYLLMELIRFYSSNVNKNEKELYALEIKRCMLLSKVGQDKEARERAEKLL